MNATSKAKLTPRQSQYLAFIRSYIGKHGYPPSVRDLGTHLGGISTNGIVEGLQAIERKGWIERTRYIARGIRVMA